MLLKSYLSFILIFAIEGRTFCFRRYSSNEVIKRPPGTSFWDAYKLMHKSIGWRSWFFGYSFEIRRSNILEDSFEMLSKNKNSPSVLKRVLNMHFKQEVYGDAGGMTKEWFDIFSTQAFNPDFGLFRFANDHYDSVEINPCAKKIHEDYLEKFELLGLFTGMAIYHERLLNVHFSNPFLKGILGRPISLEDVRKTDEEFHRSLLKLRHCDLENIKFKFIDEHPCDQKLHELKKGGKKIRVSKNNVEEFIRLKIFWKYEKIVEEQMSAFLKGLSSLIPLRFLTIFTVHELQLIIAGVRKVDVEFWKSMTTYKRCDPIIISWFWQAVKSFDEEKRTRLLQFTTGSTRLPVCSMRGFGFEIVCKGSDTKLPETHTCSNELILPRYTSYNQMLEKLSLVAENSVGYHKGDPNALTIDGFDEPFYH